MRIGSRRFAPFLHLPPSYRSGSRIFDSFLRSVVIGLCSIIGLCSCLPWNAARLLKIRSRNHSRCQPVSTLQKCSRCHGARRLLHDPRFRRASGGRRTRYIRTLIDDDANGTYDRFVQWLPSQRMAAQGLWSEGQDLYWVGDEGLWKSRDANRDLIGDGTPTKIFALPTGDEHDAHAIRRGPDGYWYLMVGNFAKGIPSLLNEPASFVPPLVPATLWRISPDLRRVAFTRTDFETPTTSTFCLPARS